VCSCAAKREWGRLGLAGGVLWGFLEGGGQWALVYAISKLERSARGGGRRAAYRRWWSSVVVVAAVGFICCSCRCCAGVVVVAFRKSINDVRTAE